MKGISPIIGSVIVIALAFSLAVFLGPWMWNLATHVANQTQQSTEEQLVCQQTSYDFDTGYGNYGIKWNFSKSPAELSVKIINTGSINLYNFSFEIYIDNSTSPIRHYDVTEDTQKSLLDPLKPGESTILKANITESISGILKEVKILNQVCPSFYLSQTV